MRLLFLLEKGDFSIKELSQKSGYSSKTIQRDLKELTADCQLQFNGIHKIKWENKERYLASYNTILQTSPRFQLFKCFLWSAKKLKFTPEQLHQVQVLNQLLQPLAIWLETKTGQLYGNERLLFELRLQFLRDFGPLYSPNELYTHYLTKSSNLPLYFVSKDQQKVVADPLFFQFQRKAGFAMKASISFYQDYQLYYENYAKLFQLHKQKQSWCFLQEERLMILLKTLLPKERTVHTLLEKDCFLLLLALENGLPIAYFYFQLESKERISTSNRLRYFQERLALLGIVPVVEQDYFQLVLCSLIEKRFPKLFAEDSFKIGLSLRCSRDEQQKIGHQLNESLLLLGKFSVRLYDPNQNECFDLIVCEGQGTCDQQTCDVPMIHFTEVTLSELFSFLLRYLKQKFPLCFDY